MVLSISADSPRNRTYFFVINSNFLLSNRNYSKTTQIGSIGGKFVLVGHKSVLINFRSKFTKKEFH